MRRLTRDPAEEFDPAWSPDGTKIAFSRFEGRWYQIYVMNADGTDPVQITHGDNSASDAAWSPDGRRIAFTRCSAGSCDIYVMNADGGGEERLTHGERPGEQDPTWSPDGRRIAFTDIGGIVVMNADGQDWTWLTDGPADDSNPDWSPNVPQIAFDGSRGLWNGDIYLVSPDGSPMTNLTDSPPLDSNPSWSPDGRSIAFMRKRNRHVQARLFVMDADGSSQTNLRAIGDAYSRPSWSPDGARLAYSWLTACIVPKVAGMRLEDARERITRASCSMGAVRFKASRGPRGIVVSQRPQARAERRIGTRVRLAVSFRR
jgi:TolB protein